MVHEADKHQSVEHPYRPCARLRWHVEGSSLCWVLWFVWVWFHNQSDLQLLVTKVGAQHCNMCCLQLFLCHSTAATALAVILQ
jgi:hypothetical protein